MIREALGAFKDQASIGLAKINTATAVLSDLHVAVVKATRHSDRPSADRHVRTVLALACRSRAHAAACAAALGRRARRTRSWAVALKALALVRRLLDEGSPALEEEVLLAGSIDVSGFRDAVSWDFSGLVRGYGRYLEESLQFRADRRRWRRRRWKSEEEEEGLGGAAAVPEMKTEAIFDRTERLQRLLDRFLACRPTGAAKSHRLVAVVLYPLVNESYQTYFDLAEIVGSLVDRFMGLPIPDCVRVRDIFAQLSKQLEDLEAFYAWCNSAGISRPSEFPTIVHITAKRLDTMDEFIERRSAMARSKKFKVETADHEQPKPKEIKALPAPPEPPAEEELTEVKVDFLDSDEETAEKLALAAPPPAWVAFKEPSDWETELVRSARVLSEQRARFVGGVDMMLLDGLYGHVSGVASGEAECGPFTASKAVAPPVWVQASEMEQKRRLAAEEQWVVVSLPPSTWKMRGCPY